ncbi:hypothetical protein [Exiguobacterium sp. NG55]|uniref:hypothetical protein n=1 Tax=Exiguobacterium sp. NG55 TaxID=375477 RepID=UPI0004DF57B7|nr:hypothetical protein [Exiguobacterium sp. NG55]
MPRKFGVGIIAVMVLLMVTGNMVLIFPLLFLVIFISIPIQISFALRIKKWEKRLRHRNITEDEFYDLYSDMKTMWWVPNHPKYWGRLKKIYFSALHSRELTLDQKRHLYEVLDELSLQGIPYPQDRKNQHRPDVKWDVF